MMNFKYKIFWIVLLTIFSAKLNGQTPCLYTLVASNNVLSGDIDHKQAELAIIAQNTIEPQGTAVYHAGTQVLLIDGFTSKDGSIFRGYIEDCTGIFVKSATTDSSNSIADHSIENNFEGFEYSVYPNPVTNVLNVELRSTDITDDLLIKLYTINGSILKNSYEISGNNSIKINTEDLPKGIYMLELLDKKSGQKTTKKIVKV